MEGIKRLIFDVDNTLIEWKKEYQNAIKKTVESYNLDVNYIDVDNVIESYENYYNVYTKENMLDLINQKFNLDLDIEFIDKWLYELNNMAEYNKEIEDTLNYLLKKYELVILTNWFGSSQKERLKKAKLDKYFKEIYDGSKCIKPSYDSFKQATANTKIDECLMIGDNYEIDLETPSKMGMKIIQVDLKDKIKDKKEYLVIKSIKELKDIL